MGNGTEPQLACEAPSTTHTRKSSTYDNYAKYIYTQTKYIQRGEGGGVREYMGNLYKWHATQCESSFRRQTQTTPRTTTEIGINMQK